MKILILGGITESKQLAQALIDYSHEVVYSIVGMVRQPELDCEIHLGGFSSPEQSGANGLAAYCLEHEIELLLDATHSYACEISANAANASQKINLDCWRFERPGWDKLLYSNWHDYDNWDDLLPQLHDFQKPFFSVGASILNHIDDRPAHQQWVVRSAKPLPEHTGVWPIVAIGPFYYEDELRLMREYNIDALISKDSGCRRVAEKLDAALTLGIPVFVQRRPQLAKLARVFDNINDLVTAVNHL